MIIIMTKTKIDIGDKVTNDIKGFIEESLRLFPGSDFELTVIENKVPIMSIRFLNAMHNKEE